MNTYSKMKIADAIESAVRTNEPVKIEGCHVNLIIMREEAFNRLKEKQDEPKTLFKHKPPQRNASKPYITQKYGMNKR